MMRLSPFTMQTHRHGPKKQLAEVSRYLGGGSDETTCYSINDAVIFNHQAAETTNVIHTKQFVTNRQELLFLSIKY